MKKSKKLPEESLIFFKNEIHKIIDTEPFQKLKNYRHHGNVSTYTHTIAVAYLSFCFALRHRSSVDLSALIRSALLHDLYFYDWHDKTKGFHFHGYKHPKIAMKNAVSLYHISQREQRHIKHHMFPLTLIPPTTKEGWIICWCDKVATWKDYRRR